MKTLIISNEEMRNIINIVTFLEEPDLLITGVIKQLNKKQKAKGWSFLYVVRYIRFKYVMKYVSLQRINKTW